jgi:hypothetical protein
VRQAGRVGLSRTAEHRPGAEGVSRQDLLRASGDNPRPAGEETDVHPVVEAEPEPVPDETGGRDA